MDHEIAVIGGGLTGIGIGAALVRAGLTDFAILERAHDFGGTWRDNHYPGVGVDVPTFGYQFSYETKSDWSRVFAKGHEMKTYIDDFVDAYGLRAHARFGIEALGRRWDDAAQLWRIQTADGREITARYVVSAVGAYIEKRPVTIPGYADFQGKLLHPTDWDHDYDLAGKRVAVIGTGATSVQIAPAIAAPAEHLDVYQRTPIWTMPKLDPEIPGWLTTVFRRHPWLRRAIYEASIWVSELTLLTAINRYTSYPWVQKGFERLVRWHMRRSLNNPDLAAKLIPEYPFAAKRGGMTNDYLQTFLRDDVELVTTAIERFTAAGIRTVDGVERPVDAVVPAVGYRMAFDPAAYIDKPVHGRDGFELGHHFATQRLKAYQGITMPGLPNYFMVFSAYSTVGASWQPMVEVAGTHIVRVLGECRRRGATSFEVTPEALDRDHASIEPLVRKSLFLNRDCSGANTYYIDHHGDAPVLRPVTLARARRESRAFPLTDYAYRVGTRDAAEPPDSAPNDRRTMHTATNQRALKTTLVALLVLHVFHALFQGGGGWNRKHNGLGGAIWKFFELSFKDPVLSAGLSDFAVVATLCATWMYTDLPVEERQRPRTYVWLLIYVLFPGLGALLYPLWIRPGVRVNSGRAAAA